MFVHGANGAVGGYNLKRSVRLRNSALGNLSRTPASSGDQRTWTWNGCFKRGDLGRLQILYSAYGAFDSDYDSFGFDSSDRFFVYAATVHANIRLSTQVFRDPAAFYWVDVALDTTNATAGNRLRVWINGTEITAWTTNTTIALNQLYYFNQNVSHRIGSTSGSALNFDGYLAEINFIDGQALTPSSFGETDTTTGVWKPKAYTGTYGTNGFYLNFEDNSGATATTIGKDSSGNGNNWTPNNISVTAGVTYDSMTDVPTLTSASAANYAVLNPLDKNTSISMSEGNIKATHSGLGAARATFAIPVSGKFYYEFSSNLSPDGGNALGFGLCSASRSLGAGIGQTGDLALYLVSVVRQYNGASFVTTSTSVPVAGNTIQIVVDATNGKMWTGVNNTFFDGTGGTTGNPSTGANPTFTGSLAGLFPFIYFDVSGGVNIFANFGQRPFAYTPPTGFVALNAYNLPDATIKKGSDNFNVVLDTGANIKTTTEALYPSNFFEWIKDRANVNNHQLIDSVRGSTAVLQSNTTAAETTYSAPSGNSVGFAWKAGGAAVSNTAGSITSQVSANASAGFSVVMYTGNGTAGATVGHGLGVAPAFVIYKIRSASVLWVTYLQTLGNTGFLPLNQTNAFVVDSTVFNNTSPTSSVLTLGTSGGTNSNTNTYVAYCFTPIAGYSAMGTYTGNGSTDGTFVYCGFRPKYVLKKRTDSTGSWYINDSARDTYNVAGLDLYADLSNAETNESPIIDFLSNGFKLRTSGGALNASGGTYMYLAFAENPFKNSLAR